MHSDAAFQSQLFRAARSLCGHFCNCTIAGGLLLLSMASQAVEPDSPWSEVLQEAKGQSVYFNAWGGSDRINAYLEWVGTSVEKRYAVKLVHVKIGDIAEVVGQLEAAKSVGRNEDGNVDLMWVNGENFAAMKRRDITWGAFADNLPNAEFVIDDPSLKADFSIPVEGLESPWGKAQLVFIHDTQVLESPPRSAVALLEYVEQGGRFVYPAPPAFHGTTFIKQLLLETADSVEPLAKPVGEADFDEVTAPLWRYLDQLHPKLRGAGKSWPGSGEMTRQLLDDGEIDIALSFNPNEATGAVKRFPALSRSTGTQS